MSSPWALGWGLALSIRVPFDRIVLQPPSGQFFPQGGCILLYRISRHELVRKPALSFDLGPDVFVKSQNGFVFQMLNTHNLTPKMLFGFPPDLGNGSSFLAIMGRAQARDSRNLIPDGIGRSQKLNDFNAPAGRE